MIKNYSTFRQLDYQALSTLKLSDSDIDSETRRYYINDVLMKVYKLVDGMSDPFYDRSTSLDFSEANIGSYYGTTDDGDIREIQVVSGNVIQITAPGIKLYQGDIIGCSQYEDDGSNPPKILNACIARILTTGGSGEPDATAQIISGSWEDPTSPDPNYSYLVHILKAFNAEGLTISLDNLYFSEIKAIHDDVARGNMAVFDRYDDLSKFREMSRVPQKKNRIGYIQVGTNVIFNVGEDADTLGNITMFYRGKPAIYNDNTEDSIIDLPPEFNQMLFDEVVAKFAQHSGKPAPDDVQARTLGYQKLYEASEASRIKALEQKLKK